MSRWLFLFWRSDHTFRNLFTSKGCIYIPKDGDICLWALPGQCVWNSHQKLKSKYALRRLYEPLQSTEDTRGSYLPHFFKTTLGVTDCTWKTYVEELKALKTLDCDDFDLISGIYTALDNLRPNIIGLSKDELK
jgi:hypothetical protein